MRRSSRYLAILVSVALLAATVTVYVVGAMVVVGSARSDGPEDRPIECEAPRR